MNPKKQVWIYWPKENKVSLRDDLFTSGGPNWENTLFWDFGPTMCAAKLNPDHTIEAFDNEWINTVGALWFDTKEEAEAHIKKGVSKC